MTTALRLIRWTATLASCGVGLVAFGSRPAHAQTWGARVEVSAYDLPDFACRHYQVSDGGPTIPTAMANVDCSGSFGHATATLATPFPRSWNTVYASAYGSVTDTQPNGYWGVALAETTEDCFLVLGAGRAETSVRVRGAFHKAFTSSSTAGGYASWRYYISLYDSHSWSIILAEVDDRLCPGWACPTGNTVTPFDFSFSVGRLVGHHFTVRQTCDLPGVTGIGAVPGSFATSICDAQYVLFLDDETTTGCDPNFPTTCSTLQCGGAAPYTLTGFDGDGDGVINSADLCPYDPEPVQSDADGDMHGDACDCAPGDSGAFALPREVVDLGWDDRVSLRWSSAAPGAGAATLHDVVLR